MVKQTKTARRMALCISVIGEWGTDPENYEAKVTLRGVLVRHHPFATNLVNLGYTNVLLGDMPTTCNNKEQQCTGITQEYCPCVNNVNGESLCTSDASQLLILFQVGVGSESLPLTDNNSQNADDKSSSRKSSSDSSKKHKSKVIYFVITFNLTVRRCQSTNCVVRRRLSTLGLKSNDT
ncbi:hypothetical protein J6590_034579 [Homalodisca vitripennis]|nr:hypothetical protein J6590_034579 [Homalodisca vitripennis]